MKVYEVYHNVNEPFGNWHEESDEFFLNEEKALMKAKKLNKQAGRPEDIPLFHVKIHEVRE